MAKRILISVIAVVVGVFVGMVVMMGLHMASTLVYPLPEGVDFMDQSLENQEQLKAWFATLPSGAFVLATVCHGLGCMAGAVIATLLSGRISLVPATVVGIVFTVGGVMNLASVPHPAWFPIVDIPIYLIVALVAGLLLKRRVAGEPIAS